MAQPLLPSAMTGTAFSTRQKLLLAVILCGQFMAVLDASIVNVAIPTIRRELGASGSDLQLIVAGYVIAYAVLLITGARLGMRYGFRRTFIWGLALFTAASFACGVAPTSQVLIVVRALQGAGAALMVPQVFSMIQRNFEGAGRAKALSLWAAALALGGLVGQVLGGVLVSANLFGTEWRPVFLVNVPIGLVLLFASFRFLPVDRPDARASARPGRAALPGRRGAAPGGPAGPGTRGRLAPVDVHLARRERRGDRRVRRDRAGGRAPRWCATHRRAGPSRSRIAIRADCDRPRACLLRRVPVHVHAVPPDRARLLRTPGWVDVRADGDRVRALEPELAPTACPLAQRGDPDRLPDRRVRLHAHRARRGQRHDRHGRCCRCRCSWLDSGRAWLPARS